jgi:hypothetical protein
MELAAKVGVIELLAVTCAYLIAAHRAKRPPII